MSDTKVDPSATHYDVLNASRYASSDGIQKAYQALCQRYGPDRNDDPEAIHMMGIVNDAYAVLNDPERRIDYDLSLKAREKEGLATQFKDQSDPLSATGATTPLFTRQGTPCHMSSIPLAGRWKRWFARIFDLWWETTAVVLIGAPFLLKYCTAYVELVNWRPAGATIVGTLCIPVALALDAVVYRLLKTTPGKMLLLVRVETADGGKLTFQQYLRRNFSLWARGLAFGLPLICLVAMKMQSKRLSIGKPASYDENNGFRVTARKAGFVRVSVFVLALVSVMAVKGALVNRSNAFHRIIQSRTAPASYLWINPITGATVTVARYWKSDVQQAKGGRAVFTFTEATGHAVLVLGRDVAKGWTMQNYVGAFTSNVAGRMNFDQGTYSSDGDSWQSTGRLNGKDLRLHIEVRRYGSTFWRVIAIQDKPYAYTDQMVSTLTSNLWATAADEVRAGYIGVSFESPDELSSAEYSKYFPACEMGVARSDMKARKCQPAL